MRTSNL